jgi:hypothetical protein
MPLASGNSLPFQVGGSPSRFESTYSAMQRMVGRNGYASDDDEIEALWRQAKADALAALGTFDERAALQASPETATDYVSVYEEILGITVDTDLSEQQRRDVIVPDYTGVPEAWTLGLNDAIHRIDPIASILVRPWINSGTCQIGRWYEPFDGSDTYDSSGQRNSTSWPNVSDAHSVIVKYDLGQGVAPNREQQRKTIQIQNHLNEVCPSWVDFHVIYSIGFELDTSLLDTTGFGR